MKMTIMFSLALSTLLPNFTTPVALMIMIILQALNTCIMIWIVSPSAWFSFILFLIFIGGLMILFIYITSLANNEMLISTPLIKMIPPAYLLVITLLGGQYLLMAPHLSIHPFGAHLQTSPLFTYAVSAPSFMIMVYLLITLIVVVKISSKLEGPIRNAMKTK